MRVGRRGEVVSSSVEAGLLAAGAGLEDVIVDVSIIVLESPPEAVEEGNVVAMTLLVDDDNGGKGKIEVELELGRPSLR